VWDALFVCLERAEVEAVDVGESPYTVLALDCNRLLSYLESMPCIELRDNSTTKFHWLGAHTTYSQYITLLLDEIELQLTVC